MNLDITNSKDFEEWKALMMDAAANTGPKEMDACNATPREELIRQLMDPGVPKSEREWCAVREIEEMLSFIREEVALWDNDGDCGFPEYYLVKKILARYGRFR